MSIVIKSRALSALKQQGIARPFIYCHPDKALKEQSVSINIEIAKKLSAINPNRRTMRMEQCFQQVVRALPDDALICDFDVMFNPNYAIDVLKIISQVAKTKPFRVIWPGTYKDRHLIYAEEGYQDYRVFDINEYDITVVI